MEVEANASGQTQAKTKFCKHCGGTIPQDAVMCTHCGRQVEELAGTAAGRYSEYQYEHQYSGGSGCRCRGKGKKQMDGVCSVSAFGLLWRAQILRGKGRDGRTLSVYVGPFWDRMVCRPYRSAHKT